MHELKKILSRGDVAVIETDTIYGIVGQALNEETVERIYILKQRTPTKPFIILISNISDVERFGVQVDDQLRARLESYWSGPVSIILDCPGEQFAYLHRGTYTLAFRMPAKQSLIEIINHTGPLVAPSANLEGLPPADSEEMVETYFQNKINFYNIGQGSGAASRIIRISGDSVEIIRA
jgi:L-threonylcarbamoyladenylate synthase